MLASNLGEAQVNSENLNSEEQLFGMAPTKFIQIQQMITALDPFLKLWKIAGSFKKCEIEWMSVPFFSLDMEKIENEVETKYHGETCFLFMKIIDFPLLVFLSFKNINLQHFSFPHLYICISTYLYLYVPIYEAHENVFVYIGFANEGIHSVN